MVTNEETKPAWDHHTSQEDGHLKAANKKEMSGKKAPKPPKAEKFAAMSSDDHRKAEDKHYDMAQRHKEAGNHDHAAAHMAIHEAHRDASSSHQFKQMAARAKHREGDLHGEKEHSETAKKYEKDAFSKLQAAHDKHSGMKKSVEDHLAEVEALLK